MNNCIECGRLVAPSSGLAGANPNSLFCGRKCLNIYYSDQPGLWDREVEEELRQQKEVQISLERMKQEQQEQKEKDENNTIIRWSLFFVFFLLTLLLGNGWVWLMFIIYVFWMLCR